MNLKILTIRAPWAHSIFGAGVPEGWPEKTIENRSWSTDTPTRIGIHVGKQIDEDGLEHLGRPLLVNERRDLGHIIGTVLVRECHRAGSLACQRAKCVVNPWAFWPTVEAPRIVHWMIGEPLRLITPFPARGMPGLWDGTDRESHLTMTGETWPSR